MGLPAADVANFVGYLLWSVWLITFAALPWRRPALDARGTKTPNRMRTIVI